jgi:methyl-accepting chemotaxis protein
MQSTATVNEPLDAIRRKADRIMCAILGLHLLYCLALAPWHGSYMAFFLVGVPTAGIAMLLTLRMPGHLLTRLVVAAEFMVLTALAIHQARGMIEMHFGFFVLFAVLLFYRDWRVYVSATLVAAIHHISFNYFQEMNYGVFCFTKSGWDVVAIHVGYVLFAFAILVYLSEVMRKETIGSDKLLQGANESNRVLRVLADRVSEVAGQMMNSVQQVGSGNALMSSRAEQQSSTLEETSAAMHQLTTTVKHNEENARQANALASGASAVAAKGGQAVGDVVKTMSGIEQSSRKIADIISVIDSIAFQTNILALNAAVEAARAGDEGRGFAVVASEVRHLAQRTATAAKEIKALIGDSVLQVEAGGKLVEEAGKTMHEIVTSTRQVTDIIAQIALASKEQSLGIHQVNQALVNMEEAAQQNSVVVESTSAAVATMHEQTTSLLDTVEEFDLAGGRTQNRQRSEHAAATVNQKPPSRLHQSAGSRLKGPSRSNVR